MNLFWRHVDALVRDVVNDNLLEIITLLSIMYFVWAESVD